MLLWDDLNHLVILKSAPFSILSVEWWVYVLGFLALSSVVWLAPSASPFSSVA